jgi:2-amino-4-hydroxy-6-hydroxymethyldihydropteridine diphosphokinase
MERVYLGLGSNQGNRLLHLKQAAGLLAENPGLILRRQSSIYETEPWGEAGQEDFCNQVLAFDCSLTPAELLEYCQSVEKQLGRRVTYRWGPRVIDVDILLFGDMTLDEEWLTIPHLYMKQRLFVLAPLEEIAPAFVFPDGQSIKEVVAAAYQSDPQRLTKQ